MQKSVLMTFDLPLDLPGRSWIESKCQSLYGPEILADRAGNLQLEFGKQVITNKLSNSLWYINIGNFEICFKRGCHPQKCFFLPRYISMCFE